MEEHCCGSCLYACYDKRTHDFICNNMMSLYYTDFIDFSHICDDWEGKDEDCITEQDIFG